MKFGWDFDKLLDDLVSELEVAVSEKIVSKYKVEYTSYGTQIIKIKVKNKKIMLDKLIVCTLFYSKNDNRYWYVTPLFTSAEKSQKTKKYELSKMNISDTKDIVNAIILKIEDIIEEI